MPSLQVLKGAAVARGYRIGQVGRAALERNHQQSYGTQKMKLHATPFDSNATKCQLPQHQAEVNASAEQSTTTSSGFGRTRQRYQLEGGRFIKSKQSVKGFGRTRRRYMSPDQY